MLAEAVAKDPNLLAVRKIELHDTVVFLGARSQLSVPLPTPNAEHEYTTEEDIHLTLENNGDTTLNLSVQCPTDTHYVTKTEYVPQVKIVQEEGSFLQPFLIGAFASFVVCIGLLRLGR